VSWKGAALALFVAGALPVAIGAASILERLSYTDRGERADAVLVEAERLYLRELLYPFDKRSIYRVTYEFRTRDGLPVTGAGTYIQGRGLAAPSAGKRLTVYYLRKDPAASHVTHGYQFFDASLLVGLGVLVWGAGAWYVRRRGRRY
jgi:hypothetical protein